MFLALERQLRRVWVRPRRTSTPIFGRGLLAAALVSALTPASLGCGECAQACAPTLLVNVALPDTLDPSVALVGQTCVGDGCSDFGIGAPPNTTCVSRSPDSPGDTICVVRTAGDGSIALSLHFSFHGTASSGETVSVSVSEASTSTLVLERSAMVQLERAEICGKTCRTQVLEL